MQAGEPVSGIALIALGCGNFGGIGSAPEFFGGGLADPYRPILPSDEHAAL